MFCFLRQHAQAARLCSAYEGALRFDCSLFELNQGGLPSPKLPGTWEYIGSSRTFRVTFEKGRSQSFDVSQIFAVRRSLSPSSQSTGQGSRLWRRQQSLGLCLGPLLFHFQDVYLYVDLNWHLHCVYVDAYFFIYTYEYMYVYICVPVCVCVSIYIYTYTYTCMYREQSINIHIYIYMWDYTRIYIYI